MDEIRLGKISSINYTDGTARVTYADRNGAVTREIPFLSVEYSMPEIGDMVLVVHLSNGAEAGVILGRPWSGKNRPPESAERLYRKDLSPTAGKSMFRYDDDSGILRIKAPTIILETDTGNTTIKSLLERIAALESK
ncbi:MAG: hypothetical protein CVU91_07470 [Firmicutes bacterium HGW-Firmicutes-16]|nr:MAG: hypothetical protein CVU91_07470 [Firmicutes bacterium HGW-Firmicutes-16]